MTLIASLPYLTNASFKQVLPQLLAQRRMTLDEICPPHDLIAQRALEEYGALFVANESVRLPSVCVFESEAQVQEFQRQAGIAHAEIEGVTIELQPAALAALLDARREALASNLNLTARGGTEAARRSYDDTLRLWNSRVLPGLEYHASCNRIAHEAAHAVRNLTDTRAQIATILEYERQGIFFSKDFSKSVMYSVALPGTSQHLSLLAFDAVEFSDARVRAILRRYGWFQTVASDHPHFTFLGRDEADLPFYGLRRVTHHEQEFWIPNLEQQ